MTKLVASFRSQVTDWNVRKFYILTPIFYILFFTLQAQEIKVHAKFNSDSVKIGKPLEFYLSARYPENVNILFPDSTFSFAPFELQKKTYFPTQTKNGVSKDSVVYTLASYEVDSIQALRLPVFVVNKMDCTQVFSNIDSVYFQNLVKAIPDSLTTEKLPLKTNTNYLGVRWQLNYILFSIAGGILLITLILVWAIFGKRIRNYFRLKKLARGYESFRAQFDASVHKLKNEFSPKNAEQSLFIWKKYMEELSRIPYTKYTTREIKQVFAGNEINLTLSAIDRMVYGQVALESVDSFQSLKSEAEKLFRQKSSESEASLDTRNLFKAEKPTFIQNKIDRQVTPTDVEGYSNLLRDLPCPFCGRTDEKLNGAVLHTVKSFVVFTSYRKRLIIGCPTTLNKKINLAILSTFLLGWWGFPWGLIRTPQYIYLNLKEKKKIKTKEPNNALLSFAFHRANEIESNRDNTEKLKEIIKTKQSWWQL